MKTIYLALMAPIIGTLGQILLKYSMNRLGRSGHDKLSKPLTLAITLASDPLLISAAALYFLGFLLWLLILSRMELSKAYPLVALSYCLVTAASWFIFGEYISPLRWMGVATICVGVLLIGMS